jgi:hypothetical protein
VASLTAVLSYLDVLLRGAILAAQALAIGGVGFALTNAGSGGAERPITAATAALDA